MSDGNGEGYARFGHLHQPLQAGRRLLHWQGARGCHNLKAGLGDAQIGELKPDHLRVGGRPVQCKHARSILRRRRQPRKALRAVADGLKQMGLAHAAPPSHSQLRGALC